jgi:hypothetical protein
MMRLMPRSMICSVLAALSLSTAALAQDVAVTQLRAPDLFSTAGADTGLGPDLWRGASGDTLRTVFPLLATKPLTPAARALARRVLATGAPGPEGVGDDAALAAMRINALIAQGGVKEASEIVSRSSGLNQTPSLAQAAAEAALLSGEDQRACEVAARLATGRDDIYWLRLRAYCQLIAGDAGAAQLTYDLAQGQARDATYGRLMQARLAGGGDPGVPAGRNGLDYALSRSLGLDMALAKPSPAVAAVLQKDEAPPPPPGDAVLADAVSLARAGQADPATLDRLIQRAASADAKARPKAQNAALLFAALGEPLAPPLRTALAAFTTADAKAPSGRTFALDQAADQKLVGETVLMALWISADAGPAGPTAGDRLRVIRALKAAGLEEDARAYAVEGLLAQQ